MDETRASAGAKPDPAGDEPAGIPGPADRRSTAVPSALPDEAVLETSPLHDDGSLVPDQLHDAPEYVPAPLGMATGAIVPPIDPGDVSSSAWITSVPVRRRRSVVSVVVTIGAVAIGLAVIALLVGQSLNLFSQRGKVIFGGSLGTACEVKDPSASFGATDVIYLAAFLRGTAGPDDVVTLRITLNGQDFVTDALEPYGAKFDCFTYQQPIGPLQPGVYVFEVLRAGVIEASGTLTVT